VYRHYLSIPVWHARTHGHCGARQLRFDTALDWIRKEYALFKKRASCGEIDCPLPHSARFILFDSITGLEYFDEETKEKYIPHCIEPSLGVDRLILALICSAYAEDEIGGETRSLLKFHPRIAPIKVAVLPLVKNKEALVSVARELFDKLRLRWNCQWDVAGAIGRRYRRADEIGVPFCITVDFETIEKDNSVTIRDRDTTDQIRLPMDEVIPHLSKAIDGY
jgi:glycyl-tRNA synthetase (class II)